MQDHQKQSVEGTPPTSGEPPEALHASPHATAADFAEASRPGDLWQEASDARCSEHAALFAETQPAPLTVV